MNLQGRHFLLVVTDRDRFGARGKSLYVRYPPFASAGPKNAACREGPIATFQDLGCVRGLLDEQQTQRANIVNGVFGKDRTCWQEDRASPMVSPIKFHPKEKPKWHIRCTTRL